MGLLPLPKQAPADPARVSCAVCQVDKPPVASACSSLLGSFAGMMQCGHIGVHGAGAEVWAVPALRSERLRQVFHLGLHDVAPFPFLFDLSVCYNSPGKKQISV